MRRARAARAQQFGDALDRFANNHVIVEQILNAAHRAFRFQLATSDERRARRLARPNAAPRRCLHPDDESAALYPTFATSRIQLEDTRRCKGLGWLALVCRCA